MKYKWHFNPVIIGLLFASGTTPTGCAELEPLQGVTVVVPINSGPQPLPAGLGKGPQPQTTQPNAPAPPLPTQPPGQPPQ